MKRISGSAPMKPWRRFYHLKWYQNAYRMVLDNIYYWKWVLIALHNALQGTWSWH